MARIRSIHPGQWSDGDFVGCSPLGRLLCLALRNHADDRGVFRWKPMQIKMICLPGDNCDIEILLKELVENDQLVQFEADGKTYAVIRDFCQWQRPKKPVVSHPLPDHLLSVAGVKVDVEKSLRQRKCEEQHGKCFYCEIEITHYSKKSNSLELDHKMPRSRGGDDSENNLVATCRKCNRAKNDMSDSEYREWLAKDGSRIPKDDAKDGSRTSIAPRNSPRKKQREEVGGREGGNTPLPPTDESLEKFAIEEHRSQTIDWYDEFERFIRDYPKGPNLQSPKKSRTAFEMAVISGADPVKIANAAKPYADTFAKKPETERKFIKAPHNFISEEMWREFADQKSNSDLVPPEMQAHWDKRLKEQGR